MHDGQDRLLVVRLCERIEEIDELREWLSEDVARRWYKTDSGQIKPHPAVTQIKDADVQITAWLSMLGFSPSDRARLGLAEIRVANELDEYRQRKARVVDAEVVSDN